jgi:hypothetical protein
LPWGIPGIGDEIEMAIQHAPHPILHSMHFSFVVISQRMIVFREAKSAVF